jgi:hypothetical protein
MGVGRNGHRGLGGRRGRPASGINGTQQMAMIPTRGPELFWRA